MTMKFYSFLLSLLISISAFSQNAEDFHKKAEDSFDNKNLSDALKNIEKAIDLDQSKFEYYDLKVNILREQKEYQKVYEFLNLIVKKFPENPWAYNIRGNFLLELNEAELAINDFEESNRLITDNDTLKYSNLTNIGTVYIRNREFEKGYNILMTCYKFNPKNVATLTNLANVCGDLGKHKEAIEYLKTAIEIKPEFVPLYTNLGFIYQSIDEHQNAINYFNKSIELDPKDAYAYNNRGFSYFKLNKLKEALSDVEKSIKMDPNNSYAYKNRALIHIGNKDVKKACLDIQLAIDKDFVTFYGEEILELQRTHCQ